MKQSFILNQYTLAYKSKKKIMKKQEIKCSEDAYNIAKMLFDKHTKDIVEEFLIMLIDVKMMLIGWARISMGGISATVVDQRIVFSLALQTNSARIILVHNHPSGIAEPSERDKIVTKKLVACGKFLDIVIADHIIISDNDYYSFADEKKL